MHPGAPSPRVGVEALLKPGSVAIVGATPRTDALGGRPIVNLRTQGFEGRVYPVNPRYENILGLPCYPDLRSLPEPPDLVLVLVGQDRIFATLDEAVKVGAKTALVFSSGFAEVSGEGVARQDRLKTYAERGLRICGPNCNGVFSIVNKTALGFTPTFEFPARLGNIAVISQSGNVNTCLSSRGIELGMGFSHLIASGNEADLEMSDYVEYLLDDPATQVFMLFVEGFKNPQRFLRVAEEALRRGKPIVLMKMGRTESSQRVALSHTGTMTGSYDVIVGALRQKGVVVVEALDQLGAVASMFATGSRPRAGRGLAVASLSGGMAGVIADACQERGVALAEFTAGTEAGLAANLPGLANLANPLDMTGQVVNEPDCWNRCTEILANDPGVDVLVCAISITAGQIERRFAEDIVALSRRGDVVPVCIWPSGTPPGSGFEVLRDAGVAVYLRVEDGIAAVAGWRRYWSTRDARLAALDALQPVASSGESCNSGWSLLKEVGISVARHVLVTRREDLELALSTLGFPIALKADSDAVAHKTELNALRLGLRNADEARLAYDELLAFGAPVLAQEMITGKRELILGLKKEPLLGLAVVVGVGGIFSELFRDISIRLAPLTAFDAEEMLSELRSRAMFDGIRGLAPVPRTTLVALLMKLSDLAVRHGGTIEELDINPVIVRDDGSACVAVDVLVKPA